MSADSVRIDCVFQDDPRLMEAVSLMLSHAARAAGVAEKDAAALAHEVLDTCRKVFAAPALSAGETAVHLLVDQFHDRVEIALEYHGAPEASEKPGDAAPFAHRAGSLQHQSGQGRSRLVFTKYCVAVDSRKVE